MLSDQRPGRRVSAYRILPKAHWIIEGSEAFFSRNMRENACSLVGRLIGFDHSPLGDAKKVSQGLIWEMSGRISCSFSFCLSKRSHSLLLRWRLNLSVVDLDVFRLDTDEESDHFRSSHSRRAEGEVRTGRALNRMEEPEGGLRTDANFLPELDPNDPQLIGMNRSVYSV